MTVKNISFGTFSYTDLNRAERHIHSGSDGKFEVYQGTKRTKWNSFTAEHSTKSDYFGVSTAPTSGGPMGAVVNAYTSIATEIPFTGALSRAQSKLIEKIKGHNFNLAVDLSQGKQTVNLISSNLGHVGRALVNLKRLNFAGAARELGIRARPSSLKTTDVSGRWLEMQYGWLPFLSSSFESMKAFAAISEGPRSSTYKVVVKQKKDWDNSQSSVNYTFPVQGTRMIIITAELTEELSASRSLGLHDPLSVLWENVPYSFVIDWFLPIGSFLDQLAVLPYLKGRFMTTEVWKADSHAGKDIKPFPDMNIYAGRRIGRYTRVVRSVTSGLSPAKPQFVSLPAAMSGKRILNAVSLFHQYLSR